MTDLDHIRTLLSQKQSPERVHQMWQAVAAQHGLQRVPQRRKRPVAFAVVGAVSAAAAAVLIVWLSFMSSTEALMMENGEPIPAAMAPTATAVHRFSDGSSLRIEKDSKIAIIESTPVVVRFALQKGRTYFEVKPGGQRTWMIDCGKVLITVLGTAFIIDRNDARIDIEVKRGTVLVSGEGVENGERRLSVGEGIHIEDERKQENKTASPEPPLPIAEISAADTVTTRRTIGNDWKVEASAGRYREAFAQLGSQGVAEVAKCSNDVDELFKLADVARLSGHPKDAVAPLKTVITAFSEDPKAGLAAYTLGRLYLEQLSSPRDATAAFDQAETLGIPEALREVTEIKRIRAFLLLGDDRGEILASDYLLRYPNGRYREQILSLTKKN